LARLSMAAGDATLARRMMVRAFESDVALPLEHSVRVGSLAWTAAIAWVADRPEGSAEPHRDLFVASMGEPAFELELANALRLLQDPGWHHAVLSVLESDKAADCLVQEAAIVLARHGPPGVTKRVRASLGKRSPDSWIVGWCGLMLRVRDQSDDRVNDDEVALLATRRADPAMLAEVRALAGSAVDPLDLLGILPQLGSYVVAVAAHSAAEVGDAERCRQLVAWGLRFFPWDRQLLDYAVRLAEGDPPTLKRMAVLLQYYSR